MDISGENNFNNTKKLAEKIDKNSFGETYVPNVFYFYSKEKVNKITKSGQKALRKLIKSI
jgi:hypothetical protein